MATNGDIATPPVPLWLDNQALPVDHSRLHPVVSAGSGKTIHYYQSATVEDAVRAVTSAGTAFKTYRNATIASRRAILEKFAQIVERDTEKFLKLQLDETSTSKLWAQNNVNTVVSYTREIASCISHMNGTIPQIDKPDTASLRLQQSV